MTSPDAPFPSAPHTTPPDPSNPPSFPPPSFPPPTWVPPTVDSGAQWAPGGADTRSGGGDWSGSTPPTYVPTATAAPAVWGHPGNGNSGAAPAWGNPPPGNYAAPGPYPAGGMNPPSPNDYGAPGYGNPGYGAPGYGPPPNPTGPAGPGGRPLAGVGARAAARIIDTLVVGVPSLFVLGLAIFGAGASATDTTRYSNGSYVSYSQTGELGSVFALLMAGLLIAAMSAVYETVFTARCGQTIGKKALKIRVVGEHGRPPGWGASASRWFVPHVLGIVPFIGSFLTLGCYLSAIPDGEQRGWHDRAAHTWVVEA